MSNTNADRIVRDGTAVDRKARGKVVNLSRKLEKLDIVYLEPGKISPNPYNPNRQSQHDFELLCRSMEDDGITQPVIVQRETLQIVDGEHRWRAAQALGYEQIPVVLVDMTAEQMRIATLRHNRARGSEDVELSAQVLRDLRELGALDWAQDSLLLDDSEMQKLLDDIPAPEALAAPSFSEAWAPSAIGTSVHNDVTVEDTGDGIDIRSASKRTAEAVKEAQARIQIAKTQEEKARIQRDLNSFRITTVYMKDEADIVRGVLGEKASDKLLEICTCIHQHGRYPA